jgi:hypothetical protein
MLNLNDQVKILDLLKGSKHVFCGHWLALWGK